MNGRTPAAARRMHTARPASTSNVNGPARTSIAAPARSRSGNGFPVPSSTTSIAIGVNVPRAPSGRPASVHVAEAGDALGGGRVRLEQAGEVDFAAGERVDDVRRRVRGVDVHRYLLGVPL